MDFAKARVKDELLFAAVAKLTVSWAHLEFALDAMIALIHATMDSAKYEKRLPRPLSEKLNYLRRAFPRLGVSEVDLPRYSAFLDEIEVASETRNDIIHGFPVHHPSDEGEAKLVRLIIEKHHWEQRAVTINATSVTAASNVASKLAGEAMNWTRVMTDFYEAHLAGQ